MKNQQEIGEYSKTLVTDIPADLKSEEALFFKQTIPKFALEAVYIYSFTLGKMLYANGWEEILGYKDDEISMLKIIEITAPEYAPFVNEVNDKALMFIHSKSNDLEQYSFLIEQKKVHKSGLHVPIVSRVGVYEQKNGKLQSIIGRFQVNPNLYFGKVMRYAAFGPEKNEFEEKLSETLFYENAISQKEKEALALVAKGFSLKEIAVEFNVSKSAIEKRILPLYKRFNLKSLPHLISFAYENQILP